MSELKVKTSTYDIKIGDKTVSLRLTIAAQLRLKNKFHQETIDTILEAANNPVIFRGCYNQSVIKPKNAVRD